MYPFSCFSYPFPSGTLTGLAFGPGGEAYLAEEGEGGQRVLMLQPSGQLSVLAGEELKNVGSVPTKDMHEFSINFQDDSKNKNQKIDFSFVSAHCASSIKTGSKLRGGVGICISLVGNNPLADPFTQTKKFGILQYSESQGMSLLLIP